MDRDGTFLLHILDEIDFLEEQFESMDFESLAENPVLQRACVRSLEIIGEAVKNISGDFKAKHPEIEWRKTTGLRDKLIHHYFGVDWYIVWDVINNKLPEMGVKMRALIDE